MSTEVCRSFAIAGKPGRYISIENGPIAESKPSIKIIPDRFFISILVIIVLIDCKNIFSLAGSNFFSLVIIQQQSFYKLYLVKVEMID